MGLKKEMEVAMKLLEKDIHEKQDTLAALRLQLDQVKTLNLQMFHKAEVGMAVCAVFHPTHHTVHAFELAGWSPRTQGDKRRKSRLRRCSWSRG